MYLSTLLIDTGDNPDRPRPGRLWLRNIYHVHQRLSMAFPSRKKISADERFLKPYDPEDFERPKFLFRIESGVRDHATRTVILVQSELQPNWDYAFQNASGLVDGWQYRPLVVDARKASRFRFRLLANPTVKREGKRFPCWFPNEDERNRREQRDFDTVCRAWLDRKGEQHGFQTINVMIERAGFKQGLKHDYRANRKQDEHKLKLAAVRFDGVLDVRDAAKFTDALRSGIGSGKTFGCGLLSALPVT